MMGNQSDPNAVRRMTGVASLHATLDRDAWPLSEDGNQTRL